MQEDPGRREGFLASDDGTPLGAPPSRPKIANRPARTMRVSTMLLCSKCMSRAVKSSSCANPSARCPSSARRGSGDAMDAQPSPCARRPSPERRRATSDAPGPPRGGRRPKASAGNGTDEPPALRPADRMWETMARIGRGNSAPIGIADSASIAHRDDLTDKLFPKGSPESFTDDPPSGRRQGMLGEISIGGVPAPADRRPTTCCGSPGRRPPPLLRLQPGRM